MAKIHGVKIVAVGRNEEKLSRARALGVSDIVDVKKVANPVKSILARTPSGRGADFVVEAVGRPEAWEQAFTLARKGVTVCLFAGCKRGSRFSLDTHRIHYEQIQLSGVFHHTPHYFFEALNLIATGRIKIFPLIESEKNLSEITQVFHKGVRYTPLKVAIVP